MTASEIVSAVFLLVGAIFIFIAGLGALRFPDVYTRTHAVSKATTLGLGCMLLGAAVTFPQADVIVKIIAVILFLFLTTPIATHMIVRAAYLHKVPQWKGTVVNELQARGTENEMHVQPADDAPGRDHSASPQAPGS